MSGKDPLPVFSESKSPIRRENEPQRLLVCLASNIALPIYSTKSRPAEFNPIKHLLLPGLGALAISVPLFYLEKPGQPAPYDWFPYAALAVVVLSVLSAVFLTRRDPTLGDRG